MIWMQSVVFSGAVLLVLLLPTSCKSGPERHARNKSLEAANRFDHRNPLPLTPMMAWHQKQNMMRHLVAIQGIVGALAEKDWAKVKSSSALIESSPRMQKMCERMGQGAPGFTELALDFHRRADAIGKAAEAKDTQAVLRTTSITLQACTACHAAFRQEVR